MSDKRSLVSICIANFNGEHLLLDCIESVLAQSGQFDIEIIVHDDASSDASLSVLARFPQVRVIESNKNVGFCIANNRMAARARGEYLLLLNNDATLLPGAISELLIAAIQSGPPRILSLPQYDWESGSLVDRGCLLDGFHVPVPNTSRELRSVAYVIGACLWIERDYWQRLGGFPEWMESIGEDIFLCAMARLQGMEVKALVASGYRHRQGASFGGNRVSQAGLVTSYRRRYLSERNRAALLIVCTPGVAWLPWLLIHIAMLVVEGAVLSVLKRDWRPWSDIYSATFKWLWVKRSLLWSLRAEVQSKRKVGFVRYLRGAYTWRVRKLSMLLRHGMPGLK